MRYTRFPVTTEDLDPEDAKILRLARVARQRAYVPAADGDGAASDGAASDGAEGAAVRDTDGRTYAAATVAHPNAALSTSALQGALSAAYSSGARTFEAIVVLGSAPGLSARDGELAAALAPGVPALLADARGVVVAVTTPATANRS